MNAFGRSGRGLARNGLKQYSAALLDFDTAVIMAPQFGAGFVDRGLTRMALQQPERALPDFSEAILIDPKNAAAYENRGAAFIALQRLPDAIADYTQAALLDPNNPAVFNDRGSAYLRSGDAPRALADYQKALQLNGEFWQARTNLALLHIERGEYAAAEQQLRSALRGLQKSARPRTNAAFHGKLSLRVALVCSTRCHLPAVHQRRLRRRGVACAAGRLYWPIRNNWRFATQLQSIGRPAHCRIEVYCGPAVECAPTGLRLLLLGRWLRLHSCR